jgi:hypothetical protein
VSCALVQTDNDVRRCIDEYTSPLHGALSVGPCNAKYLTLLLILELKHSIERDE